MERATVSASWSLAAPSTSTVMSLVAPSPSAAIMRAKSSHTAYMAAATAGYAGESGPMASPPALPVASRTQVSLVDVSESTVTLLNVCRTVPRSAACTASLVSGASVESTLSRVAMLGIIMPDPFTKPPTCTVDAPPSSPGSSSSYELSLGTVSVVITARAAWCAPRAECSRAAAAIGTPVTKPSIGNGLPMTPVDPTSTSSSAHPNSAATSAAVLRATSRPGAPVDAFALPELSTTAQALPLAARSRET